MVGNSSQSGRAVLTGFPSPPVGFLNISEGTPGKYVFGAGKFVPDPELSRINLLHDRISPKLLDEVILGLTTVLLIIVINKCVSTCIRTILPNIACCFVARCESQMEEWKDFDEGMQALLSLHLKQYWRHSKQDRLFWRRRLCVAIAALLMFALQTIPIIFAQTESHRSDRYEYNLKGSHPIGTSLGLGRYRRRTGLDRPCVTPVINESNPVRDFSISTCVDFNLKEAHDDVNDIVFSVKIGSWFHSGGSDHEVRFGNASIAIRSRAFLSGVQNGTWRIRFRTLNENHTAVTRYLHQVVIYDILNASCHADNRTKSCAKLFAEHQMKETALARNVQLWVPKGQGPFDNHEDVEGLETTLEARIRRPWSTVFRRLGPLITTELIEEVAGPGSYSHIASEQREEGIPGLLYQSRRKVSVFVWLIILGGSVTILVVVQLWECTLSRAHPRDDLSC